MSVFLVKLNYKPSKLWQKEKIKEYQEKESKEEMRNTPSLRRFGSN